jgi:transcriptional regulator NrdR family protein
MTEVIKRDGGKETFNPDKLINSIRKAVIDAGMGVEQKKEMIEQVSRMAINVVEEKGRVSTRVLRDKILSKLDEADSAVADAWRRFDHKYKPEKTSPDDAPSIRMDSS